ncbi:MAG: DUF3794 domain-containing protein [Ruminococcus sp.]|nr:DUF3794 domain-containing protein [Ruminococcus sp.]
MMNCDYTNSTIHGFYNEIVGQYNNAGYVGIASGNTLSRALQCGSISNQWVQFFVPKILDIPVQKPDSEGIVTVNSAIEIISQRVVNTPVVTGYTNANGVFVPGESISNSECTHLTGKKLIIEGVIHQKVIYTALVADQSLHSADFTIPFSTFIIVDADTPLSQDFTVYPYLEDVFTCQLSERSIFSNNTIFIKTVPVC